MAPDNIEDDVIALVEWMKSTAPADTRDRVGKVVVRHAEHNQKKPALQHMVIQILELESGEHADRTKSHMGLTLTY